MARPLAEACECHDIGREVRRVKGEARKLLRAQNRSLRKAAIAALVTEELRGRADLTSVPMHFGGRRWFHICSRCLGSVLCLYRVPGAERLACARCAGLRWASSDPHGWRRARLLPVRLASVRAELRALRGRPSNRLRRDVAQLLRWLEETGAALATRRRPPPDVLVELAIAGLASMTPTPPSARDE